MEYRNFNIFLVEVMDDKIRYKFVNKDPSSYKKEITFYSKEPLLCVEPMPDFLKAKIDDCLDSDDDFDD